MSAPPNFRELQDRIVEMRRQRRFSEEAELLATALEQRPTAKLEMLLSRALIRSYDYSGALSAADRALAGDPALSAAFADHLGELAAVECLIAEVEGLALSKKRAPPATDKVSYCLQNALPYRQGGYAMRSHAMARAALARGRQLSAFVRPGFPSDTGRDQPSPQGEDIVDRVSYHFDNDVHYSGNTFPYLVEATERFAQAFPEQSIGLVHAATSFWVALPAALAAHRLGLPFVYEVRSFWEITRDAREPGFAAGPQARRDRLLEAITLALADRVITLNAAMRSHLTAAGVDDARIVLIPNCVDVDRFQPRPRDAALARHYGISEGDVVIGYLGAMLAYEGLDSLVDAAAVLAARDPAVRLLIVGATPGAESQEGTIEAALARQITGAGMEGRIRLVERVPPDCVPDHYTLFDICAYPRRGYEVCEIVPPLKPLEAMAAGKAIVVSDVGGMRDLVDNGDTGLVCARDDPESLFDALARLSGDSQLRERLGQQARRFVCDNRSWDDAGARLELLYDSLCSGEALRSPDAIASDVRPALSALFGTRQKDATGRGEA